MRKNGRCGRRDEATANTGGDQQYAGQDSSQKASSFHIQVRKFLENDNKYLN
jgi:hypothetical protein